MGYAYFVSGSFNMCRFFEETLGQLAGAVEQLMVLLVQMPDVQVGSSLVLLQSATEITQTRQVQNNQ